MTDGKRRMAAKTGQNQKLQDNEKKNVVASGASGASSCK
jgi:hypothetical protein